ncbi:MAG: NAD-dependent epimerase/dehydratase family protein [Planctomycetota bacterium]|nr:MAG: NAD-dependent epimerase/dehydratase family protein [Planctomycetota bacterium]
MRVLVTGSSGQIGTNLALRLLDAGEEVLGLDRRPNPWTGRFRTVRLDLLEPLERIEEALADEGWDVLVHLAAHAKVHELVVHPERSLENVRTTFAAAELARRRGTPLVFGSSREAYGDVGEGLTAEDRPVVALSPYSASKIAGEALVRSYANCYGVPTLTFRFSNVYGRYDNDLERLERVTPLFIRELAAGREVTIYGRDKVLDFTYVDDCVAAVHAGIEALARGRLRDETINVATGQGSSLVDLAEYVADALGVEARYRVEPSRPGEITRYVADIGKARRLLGYEPTTFLREGVRKAVRWSGTQADPAALRRP